MTDVKYTGSSPTAVVVTLLFLWIVLVLLLVYFYKRLNRDTNNQYTVTRLVNGQGGLRDRVQLGVELVTRLVDRIRPQNQNQEESINDDCDGRKEEDGEDEDGKAGSHDEFDKDEEDGNSSDDYSSIDLQERVMKNNGKEEREKKTEEEQKKESKDEEKEEVPEQEEEVKDEERVSLLVNVKPFSGSANWSEDKKEESNVTAL